MSRSWEEPGSGSLYPSDKELCTRATVRVPTVRTMNATFRHAFATRL